ncbi:GNAT family N-acetyltransferase [Seohaeicola saemankumensis]|nr:GNAT family N-acetyltransferase [Seohaeicola saemankumensis]MCA0869773.1 GNAT family N-acetyltransferase [Seohaeicola saemankumensis]
MTHRTFRNATPADAARCFEIETAAYDGDEAATLDKIATRIAEYPQGFLVLEIDGGIAGFINSGCAHEVEMADEGFKELIGHDPAAPNVVILSVVVDPAHQGGGLSTALMSEFVGRMTRAGKDSIHLMCKRHHVALYEKFGYRYTRPSASDHGGVSWHEMIMELPAG